jgi:hypothetical protein
MLVHDIDRDGTVHSLPAERTVPDLVARHLLMSAYLYYRRHSPVVSDAIYDAMTDVVVANWDRVHPMRQWQMDSPAAIASTGYHCKITRQTEGAACAWYALEKGDGLGGDRIGEREWRMDPWMDVFWAPAGV